MLWSPTFLHLFFYHKKINYYYIKFKKKNLFTLENPIINAVTETCIILLC